MAKVDLGYSEPCESGKLQSNFFPSKIGGKPAWLDLEGVPSVEELSCTKCGEPMTFLCQVYAPYEEDDNNFHRTLFLFVCRKSECDEKNKTDNMKLIRANLGRANKFFPYDPPTEELNDSFPLSKWLSLCEVCGCVGTKKCSKCNAVSYCSRQHQVLDWKEKHKSSCGKGGSNCNHISHILYPESEIAIEPEDFSEEAIDEDQEKEEYLNLVRQGTETMPDANEEELDQYSAEDPDKTFTKFRRRIEFSPDQILRYERGGDPLHISNEGIPNDIPKCEYCGGPRQYEFQIMPQLLSMVKEENVDWGILICYTCVKSCKNGKNYKEEFIVKQDVADIDLNH